MSNQPARTAADRPAISAGWFYVPYEAVGTEASIRTERNNLTWKSRYHDGDKPIRMFKDLPGDGYLGMPRAYGMLRYPQLAVEDHRTDGLAFTAPPARLPDPNHPAVKEPKAQAKFMAELDQAVIQEQHFLAEATTGSGKTVCSMRSAAIRGRKTAVLVPLERLMDQWHKEIATHLGIPENKIGVVQSDTCEWEDKDFVLCMMKSMGMRRYHPEFYKSVGTVIVDEAHRLGTPELAMITTQFPARVRFGMSATLDRTDGSDRVIFWHIGPRKVRSVATAVDCHIYVKRYDDGGRMAAIPPLKKKKGKKVSDHGFRIKKLTEDGMRNQMLVHYIKRLWNSGRKILAIGDHVGHVQVIMQLCAQAGIPPSAMGQCTGERHIRNGVKVTKKKVTREEFDHAKENADIVFATYGSFKEGIDEPRLDAGIELSPQSKAKQTIGRVRRPHPGKDKALWITIVDEGDWMSRRYFMSRLKDYRLDGTCTVIEGKI